MIYGKRIRLRAVEKTDLPKFHEWINDPEVMEGIGVYLPLSMMDEEQWLERSRGREPDEKPLAIELLDRKNWRLIGNCGFFNIEWTSRAAEFGIMIGDKAVWNRGHGTEAVNLILSHGFETLNLNRIYLRVYSTNPRARRVYEKAGFILEGTMRQAVYRHGCYADVSFMSVLRPEWDVRREGT